MVTLEEAIEFANSDEQVKKWAKFQNDKFVSKGGQNLTAEEWAPTPEQFAEAEAHFAELEKLWGVKFERYPLPGDPDYDEALKDFIDRENSRRKQKGQPSLPEGQLPY